MIRLGIKSVPQRGILCLQKRVEQVPGQIILESRAARQTEENDCGLYCVAAAEHVVRGGLATLDSTRMINWKSTRSIARARLLYIISQRTSELLRGSGPLAGRRAQRQSPLTELGGVAHADYGVISMDTDETVVPLEKRNAIRGRHKRQ